jgi:nitroreductase
MFTYQALIDLLKARRSIRAFKPDPIPEGYIEKIIEAARWAPSGGDGQPWEFIVIQTTELKEKVVNLYMKAAKLTFKREQDNDPDLRRHYMVLPVPEPKFKDAPAFIILVGDERTNIAFPLRVQETKGEEVLVSGLASTFLCMHLAARALGLGSQWVSGMADRTIEEELRELLNIPPHMMIYDMMAVGYPAYDPGHRSPRNLKDMIHIDGFQREKYRSPEEIREFVKMLRKSR